MDTVPAAVSTKKSKKKNRQRYRGGPWVTARKIVQYLALAVFIALFLGSRQDGWAGDLVNIPLRLDPLLILSHLLASRTFLAGSALGVDPGFHNPAFWPGLVRLVVPVGHHS